MRCRESLFRLDHFHSVILIAAGLPVWICLCWYFIMAFNLDYTFCTTVCFIPFLINASYSVWNRMSLQSVYLVMSIFYVILSPCITSYIQCPSDQPKRSVYWYISYVVRFCLCCRSLRNSSICFDL